LEEAALAASSSASYKITSEKIAPAAAAITSTSYRVQSSVREREMQILAISGYKIGEGFMRTAYFGGAVILAPIVTSISPSSATSGDSISLTISGANFTAGSTVALSLSGQTSIVGTNVSVVSSSQITCDFSLANAVSGLWAVTVTSADGRSGSLPSALNVSYAAPTITSITPATGLNNAAVSITGLIGTNFRSGAAVKLQKTGQSDIIASNVSVVSVTKITCVFDITNADPGSWDVVVTNSDSQSAVLSGGFRISAPNIEVIGVVRVGTNIVDFQKGAAPITYTLSSDANITLFIFNMRGEKIWEERVVAGSEGGQAGANTIMWDGITAFRARASAGVYFVYVNVIENGQTRTLAKTKFAVLK